MLYSSAKEHFTCNGFVSVSLNGISEFAESVGTSWSRHIFDVSITMSHIPFWIRLAIRNDICSLSCGVYIDNDTGNRGSCLEPVGR